MDKYKKIFFAALSFFILPDLAWAAPSVATATPMTTFSHGSVLNISGSGFGIKSPIAPWLYDDFENGATNGVAVAGRTSLIGNRTWGDYLFNAGGSVVKYDSSQAYNSSYSVSQTNSADANGLWVGSQATQKRYVSYQFRTTRATLTGAGNTWKMDRTTSGLEQGSANPPYDAFPNLGWGDGLYVNPNGTPVYWVGDPQYISMPAANSWHRMELYHTMSSPAGASNGIIKYWEDGELLMSTTANTCSSGAWICQIDTWMTPLYANDGGAAITISVDDVYIDNTLARVEICNANTKSASTHCEIQIPQTIWNDSQVQIKINQGSFAGNATAYLYVIDASGNANATGKQIIFGSIATPVTYAPSDFLNFSANWFKRDTPFDLNADNMVNAKDLGMMMSKWN